MGNEPDKPLVLQGRKGAYEIKTTTEVPTFFFLMAARVNMATDYTKAGECAAQPSGPQRLVAPRKHRRGVRVTHTHHTPHTIAMSPA